MDPQEVTEDTATEKMAQEESKEESKEEPTEVAESSSEPSSPVTTPEETSEKSMNKSQVGPHDVLLGRGLGTYNHIGNVNFRKLVNKHKLRYVACCKVDKPKIARELVKLWRQLDPPGRFLERKEAHKKGDSAKPEHSEWREIGDKRGQEKASQCLRERTADVLPYYKYVRACKKVRKDRAMSQGMARCVVHKMNVIAAAEDRSGVDALRLKNQLELQQKARAFQASMMAPTSMMAPSTNVPLLQLQFLQQQQPARRIQTTPMVPLELLLRREQELKEREMEAQILRSTLNAAGMQARPNHILSSANLMPSATANAFHSFPSLGGRYPIAMAPTASQFLRAPTLLGLDRSTMGAYPQGMNFRMAP